MEDEAFDKCNPNCWYTLFFGFMSSAVNFHAADGSGYSFMMDVLLELDTKIVSAQTGFTVIFLRA